MKIKCHFNHITSRLHSLNMAYLCDVILNTWRLRACLPSILTVKLPFPPLSTLSSLEGRHYASSHLRGGELCSTFLRAEQLCKLFEIFLHRIFVHSSPFLNLFNYLLWTHGYLFYTLSHNPALLYLFLSLKLFQLWPLGVFKLAPIFFTYPHHLFFQHFPAFLLARLTLHYPCTK